jgi:hypothetical protein
LARGSMMRVAIIQPHFLPFAGYFDLLQRADLLVYYDTVQFRKRSWHCRTWLSEQGIACWFSAPVDCHGGSRLPLNRVLWADNQSWRTKAARRLRVRYGASKEPRVLEMILDLIISGPSHLAEWNMRSCGLLATALGISTPTLRASELPAFGEDKQQRLIHICRECSATRYLCGPGSRNYVRDEVFAEYGIQVEWLDYNYSHRLPDRSRQWVYPSLLDLILSRGLASARKELGLLV